MLVGCASCVAREQAAGGLPSWYAANNAYPAEQYLVGQAACGDEVAKEQRLTCAIARATEEAALTLGARVTAIREQACRLDTLHKKQDGVSESRAQSACRSSLEGHSEATLELVNASPREHTCDAQHCYALVVLSRTELASRVENSVAAQRTRFEQLTTRALSVDLLSGLSLLGEAEQLAGPLDQAATQLSALLPTAASFQSYTARLVQARRARLLHVSVCLQAETEAEPAAEAIFAPATVLLSEQGLDQVRIGSSCPAAALLIDYTPSEPRAEPAKGSNELAGLWIFRYAGVLRVSSGDGSVARERSVQGRGIARSEQSARRDAEERLATDVRAAIAELVLGQAT